MVAALGAQGLENGWTGSVRARLATAINELLDTPGPRPGVEPPDRLRRPRRGAVRAGLPLVMMMVFVVLVAFMVLMVFMVLVRFVVAHVTPLALHELAFHLGRRARV